MINTIKKAIDRIVWRTSNGWKANENDVEAINFLIDYVNRTTKENVKNNSLIAKLYILAYSEQLKKYNATVFDKIPEKELLRNLDRPIEFFIEDFKNDLNTSELYTKLNDLGISLKHPLVLSDDERKKESEILDKPIDISDIWDYETIAEHLEMTINNIINLHAK